MNDLYHDVNDDTHDMANGAQSTNAKHTINVGRYPLRPRSSCYYDLKNELDQFESDLHSKTGARRQPEAELSSGGKPVESDKAVEGAGNGQQKEVGKENGGAKGRSHFSSIGPISKAKQSKDDSSLIMIGASLHPTHEMEGFIDPMVTCASTRQRKESNTRSHAHQPMGSPTHDTAKRTLQKDCKRANRDSLSCEGTTCLPTPVDVHAPAIRGTEHEATMDLHASIGVEDHCIGQIFELCHGVCRGAHFDHAREDSLAVAVAVVGDEEHEHIPAALKYDPERKTPARRSRRRPLYFVLATLLMVAICSSVTFGVLQGNSLSKTEAPRSATSPDGEGNGIFYQLVVLVGEANLVNPNSSQARAADWIINKDLLALNAGSDNLAQRYLLALFYISTTEDKEWLSCNPPTAQEGDDCIFSKISGGHVDPSVPAPMLGRWLSARHECEWAGIKCDEFNQTRTIDLAGQDIRGTFPPEISLLPFLQSIALPVNRFYGTLPSELSSTKHLLNVELQYNHFTGQIPEEWYNIGGFQALNLAGNFITGTISTAIGTLTTLKGWFIQENALEGTIPTEIGNVKPIGKYKRCCLVFRY